MGSQKINDGYLRFHRFQWLYLFPLLFGLFSGYFGGRYFSLVLAVFFDFQNAIFDVFLIVLIALLLMLYLHEYWAYHRIDSFFEKRRRVKEWDRIALDFQILLKPLILAMYLLTFSLYAWALTTIVNGLLDAPGEQLHAYSVAGGLWGGFVSMFLLRLQELNQKTFFQRSYPALHKFRRIIPPLVLGFFINSIVEFIF